MTAVLNPANALWSDRAMASLDDSQINYSSSSDWKAKYHEVADMLAETRAELDDFQHSSKELEEELERELERTEKAQQDMKIKVAKSEMEREDWKNKFMSLQTTHNTTTTSLQRELDTLRQEHQKVKVQLRDLEMGNDDLERNERAVSSSLADIEAKYTRALEEKILLEHELFDKATLEEECQRLKDELRDANVEVSILKDQLAASQATKSSASINTAEEPSSSTPSSLYQGVSRTDDDLLTTPPPDMQLADLSPVSDSPSDSPYATTTPRPKLPSIDTTGKGQSALLQRAGFQPGRSNIGSPSGSPINRSSTLPTLSSTPTRIPPRTPSTSTRTPASRNTSNMSTSTVVPGTASKSKGVQMVSEMRARVRVLEQKIHTRVPRLRMGSAAGKPPTSYLGASTIGAPTALSSTTSSSSSSSITRTGSLKSTAADEHGVSTQRRSIDEPIERRRTPAPDSSGWVLIMEDSPSPVKDKEKQLRRVSSPTAPTAFRSTTNAVSNSSSSSSNLKGGNSLAQSTMNTGIRRPQSRLSGASLSTTTTSSSIPTPSSRPASPSFLPVPSSGLYAHQSTAGATGLKRSTGPPGMYSQQPKRSSLTASTMDSPYSQHRERPLTMPASSRPASGTPSPMSSTSSDGYKALPKLPALQANVTMRQPSKLPSSSALGKSRIGRPSGGGRRSAGPPDITGLEELLDPPSDAGRSRSGSTTSAFGGRNGY
ncbi:hypothetical protein PLICRDRAFT_100265 [Plicaturopsis crispa FD-325 SS-3]|nr:hypothetical protein PLICRDRAFT_100265 [Plicaturopsis crispa FD-325 SS-3]